MPKRISAGEGPGALPELRVVVVTLDNHLAGAVERARRVLAQTAPGLILGFHAAAEWDTDPAALDSCRADIARADIVLSAMLFMDEHVRAVLPALLARRPHCDAMVGCLSAAEVVRTTRMNRFAMDGSQRGALDFLKRLRGKSGPGGASGGGARQMALVRQIPRILRFIPGSAQDVRAYFLTLQYWLAGSDENVVNLVRFLAGRYAAGERAGWRQRLAAEEPRAYPETGLYHPRMPGRLAERPDRLPAEGRAGRVGLLLMRSYVLAGNTAHYDGVIAALEARGLSVVPAFASGLDNRPAVEKFFLRDGRPAIDALVSLTGFSLVGGPAYNDAAAASAMLARLDVPYLAAQAVEFQSLEQWEVSERGLSPVEATMMVAIPELDGATAPMVFGGRAARAEGSRDGTQSRDMAVHPERAARLADRVAKLVALRARPRAERRVAVVLFNFPPNAGATGTAAFLSVWESLHRVLLGLKADGYAVEIPETVDALRARVLEGNAARYGTPANVAHRISADDHVRREAHLAEIEAQWGPAPGRHQSDGGGILVLGAHFGNVFVGVQPAFGYEGDPMRLLFERGFAPTHAFSAFYRYLREDFCADAVLHFGTHGALEFMPGKQTGLSAACWPERLIGALPNVYLYATNNPSEGTLAKRRTAATLVSYLTPSLAQAGLYRGLIDLKASLERRRALPPEDAAERAKLAVLIHGQALALDLAEGDGWGTEAETRIADLGVRLIELEHTLIPHGLHVVGQGTPAAERADLLLALASSVHGLVPDRAGIERLVAGAAPEEAAGPGADDATLAAFRALAGTDRLLAEDHEIPALLRALDGRFVPPVAGGDVLRSPAILPTGRNLHGFDPYRIPSAFALADGRAQVERLLARHAADGGAYPESIALVLWGSDNLKSEGAPVAQALALMGAAPRFDGYGRLCGAVLIPLEDLGRPRIDVVATLSGIFRDLLPLQTKLLAEAAYLAATADEPEALNFVRKHALAHQAAHGIDIETAALRVFSNAEGAYGANLNHLVDSGRWDDEAELCETFSRRKSFAYGRDGRPEPRRALMQAVLAGVDLAYQNLDSVEVGVTSVDHYFDGLGGMARAVAKARGTSVPVYISDQTRGEGRVRSLSEQVALETRTRMLNPKWAEGMLGHGYEGVRQIDQHLTNTVGWSATTDGVAPWIYQRITETYVLDEAMRERMAALNPAASAKVAHRLIEAHRRGFWTPDPETRAALDRAEEALEDRLEGITAEAAE
ncbi:magnesium chelatase subunit H [Methylobacterium oryzihabitans]|uniref:magnesium chelatase n=1 Tax=Methylobacterium oryzihabitans TaxID=2499852 RepID=A0A437PET1_9HYPH|nr:magnesium chelatase subunit H [Methylobacterium oryzihabitans]RVU20749.1 magnesium chelatase subunit H [Methylobacterium oryzihabitans]